MELIESEVRNLLAWLTTQQPESAQRRAAVAIAEQTLKKIESGAPSLELRSDDIADQADVAAYKDPTQARRWLRSLGLEKYFDTWQAHQISWLKEYRPGTAYSVGLRVQTSRGGRHNATTYSLVRVPLASYQVGALVPANNSVPIERPDPVAPARDDIQIVVEADSPPSSVGSRLIVRYEMAFCEPGELTLWGRLIFGKGGVPKRSWRFRLIAGRFIGFIVAGLLIFLAGIVLPLSGYVPLNGGLLAASLMALAFMYWNDVRPFVRLVEDRIHMAGDGLMKEIKPAQLEIWREQGETVWRLVRYTSSCAVCASPLDVQRGEPDFPRRLVGRCSESPREHVFSFDRITRLGRPLIAPPS